MNTATIATQEPKLTDFLFEKFHAGAVSVKEVMERYLENATPSEKREILKIITAFILNTEYTLEEKEDYVSETTSFLLKTHPMEWLQKIAKQIEEDLDSK